MTKDNNIMDFTKELSIKANTSVDQTDFLKALNEVTPGFGFDQSTF